MNTRSSLYRTTLVAAAVAVGCFGAVSAASAHDHDRDRDRDGDRHAYGYRAQGWHERGGHRREEGYYRPAPVWRPAYREVRDYGDGYYDAYPPVVAYRPAPRPEIVYRSDGDVSVVIHVPL